MFALFFSYNSHAIKFYIGAYEAFRKTMVKDRAAIKSKGRSKFNTPIHTFTIFFYEKIIYQTEKYKKIPKYICLIPSFDQTILWKGPTSTSPLSFRPKRHKRPHDPTTYNRIKLHVEKRAKFTPPPVRNSQMHLGNFHGPEEKRAAHFDETPHRTIVRSWRFSIAKWFAFSRNWRAARPIRVVLENSPDCILLFCCERHVCPFSTWL